MSQDSNFFVVKPLNQWMRDAAKRPAPRMLFGDFWSESEIAVLFSDIGKGKSILGVQIAQSIASGVPLDPVRMTAKPQKVVYFDFELSSQQFARRYSSDPGEGDEFLKCRYRFSRNFIRANLARRLDLPPEFKTFEDYFLASIEDLVRSTGAKVIIIDNIAWLQGDRATARHTIHLMRKIAHLRSRLDISILILAHNPRRETCRPLDISGLQGAGVICNFADSVFAIGQSRIDASFRYIKHIKSRNTEIVCDEGNVLVAEIRKWEKNFLSFRFHRFSKESDHLARERNPMIEVRAIMIRNMTDEGMTQRAIAKKLGLSLGSVNRYLQMTKEDDEDYFDLDDGFYDDDDDNNGGNGGGGNDDKSSPPANLNELNKPNKLSELPDDDHDEDPMARYGLTRDYDAGGSCGLDDTRSEPGAGATGFFDELTELNQLGLSEPGAVATGFFNELSDLNELNELNKLNKLNELSVKTLDNKIEVGDIVMNRRGRLMRRTFWGWDDTPDLSHP